MTIASGTPLGRTPWVSARLSSASLHAPMPVSRSGVRLEPFTVKNGSLNVCEPPDRRRRRLGPISGGVRRGVWQLLQAPMVLTR